MSRPLQVPAERTARLRPSFECIALVLQGGGALGAYQAGVYEALAEADLHPNWAAGISIGAINAALIAGNPPEARVDKLRAFWEGVTENPWWYWGEEVAPVLLGGVGPRRGKKKGGLVRRFSRGARGFSARKPPPPWLHPAGTSEATSLFDTNILKGTLERLIDFNRINSGDMRSASERSM